MVSLYSSLPLGLRDPLRARALLVASSRGLPLALLAGDVMPSVLGWSLFLLPLVLSPVLRPCGDD